MVILYRGHGTFVDNEKIVASVTGTVEIVNKLISVKPLKTRYNVYKEQWCINKVREYKISVVLTFHTFSTETFYAKHLM